MSVRIVAKSIWANPGNQGQKLRRTGYAVLWQAWKRIVRRPWRLTLRNGRRFIAYPDCVVSSSLIYSQCPEYLELNFVRDLLCPDDIVVDVGANVGHIGLLLSDTVSPQNILAFEPTPLTFQRLSENWAANRFPQSGLHQVAIGDHEGTAVLPDVRHPDSMNSLVTPVDDQALPTIEVPLRPLDSFRDQWNSKRLGLIKIDVEGYELAVFHGAAITLREDRPRLIMFESLQGVVHPKIVELLSSCDYRVFQLDDVGNPELDHINSQNLFATPNEWLDDVVGTRR